MPLDIALQYSDPNDACYVNQISKQDGPKIHKILSFIFHLVQTKTPLPPQKEDKRGKKMATAARLWKASCKKRYGDQVMNVANVHVVKALPRVIKELETCAEHNCLTRRDALLSVWRGMQGRRDSNGVEVYDDAAASALQCADHGMASVRFKIPPNVRNEPHYVPAFIDVLSAQAEMKGIRVLGDRGSISLDYVVTVTFDWRPVSVAQTDAISRARMSP